MQDKIYLKKRWFGARKMTQQIKCLPYEPEDLSLDSQTLVKLYTVAISVTPAARWEAEIGGCLEADGPASLEYANKRPCVSNEMEGENSHLSSSDLHTPWHVHSQCVHTNAHIDKLLREERGALTLLWIVNYDDIGTIRLFQCASLFILTCGAISKKLC